VPGRHTAGGTTADSSPRTPLTRFWRSWRSTGVSALGGGWRREGSFRAEAEKGALPRMNADGRGIGTALEPQRQEGTKDAKEDGQRIREWARIRRDRNVAPAKRRTAWAGWPSLCEGGCWGNGSLRFGRDDRRGLRQPFVCTQGKLATEATEMDPSASVGMTGGGFGSPSSVLRASSLAKQRKWIPPLRSG